jgi:hypothetical protein
MLVWHWMWDDCASAILQMRMKCVVLVVFTQWLLAGIYISRLYSHHFGRSVDYLLPSFDVWSDL